MFEKHDATTDRRFRLHVIFVMITEEGQRGGPTTNVRLNPPERSVPRHSPRVLEGAKKLRPWPDDEGAGPLKGQAYTKAFGEVTLVKIRREGFSRDRFATARREPGRARASSDFPEGKIPRACFYGRQPDLRAAAVGLGRRHGRQTAGLKPVLLDLTSDPSAGAPTTRYSRRGPACRKHMVGACSRWTAAHRRKRTGPPHNRRLGPPIAYLPPRATCRNIFRAYGAPRRRGGSKKMLRFHGPRRRGRPGPSGYTPARTSPDFSALRISDKADPRWAGRNCSSKGKGPGALLAYGFSMSDGPADSRRGKVYPRRARGSSTSPQSPNASFREAIDVRFSSFATEAFVRRAIFPGCWTGRGGGTPTRAAWIGGDRGDCRCATRTVKPKGEGSKTDSPTA